MPGANPRSVDRQKKYATVWSVCPNTKYGGGGVWSSYAPAVQDGDSWRGGSRDSLCAQLASPTVSSRMIRTRPLPGRWHRGCCQPYPGCRWDEQMWPELRSGGYPVPKNTCPHKTGDGPSVFRRKPFVAKAGAPKTGGFGRCHVANYRRCVETRTWHRRSRVNYISHVALARRQIGSLEELDTIPLRATDDMKVMGRGSRERFDAEIVTFMTSGVGDGIETSCRAPKALTYVFCRRSMGAPPPTRPAAHCFFRMNNLIRRPPLHSTFFSSESCPSKSTCTFRSPGSTSTVAGVVASTFSPSIMIVPRGFE